MQRLAVVLCLLVVLPLLAEAGNINKDDEKTDADKKESRKDRKSRFMVKGDPPRNSREIFKIPENQTEEDWHQEQYDKFQENDYNQYQKHQFQEHERQRFMQWQMERFQHKMAERQMEYQKDEAERRKDFDKEMERFVFKQKVQMKNEQEKHNKWLRSLLANDKERKKLLKQIRQREHRQAGEL